MHSGCTGAFAVTTPDLVLAEPDVDVYEVDCGVVDGTAVPEGVDSDEAEHPKDMHDVVRILEGVGNAAEGALEEVWHKLGICWRAGEVACEEVDGVDER